jgi:hypothetical protein
MERSLQTTYETARATLGREAELAAWETSRVEHALGYLRMLVVEHGLGVELRSTNTAARPDPHGFHPNSTRERWHHITLTTPSGGRCVVGQVRDTKDLTLEHLHTIVGSAFFVRSVDSLAAQAAREKRSEERAGVIGLVALGLLAVGVLYACL